RRHTRCLSDWSSDVCSSDLTLYVPPGSWYISRPIDIGNTQSIQIRGERAVSDDEQNSPPGAWIAVSSHFPSAGTMLRFHGVRSRSEERRVGKEGRAWGVGMG